MQWNLKNAKQKFLQMYEISDIVLKSETHIEN